MSSGVQLTEAELLELYGFMEKANELFHQPMNYSDSDKVAKFGQENYPLIRKWFLLFIKSISLVFIKVWRCLLSLEKLPANKAIKVGQNTIG